MAKKLARTVYVDGKPYAKGTEPAKDVADQITNPAAWEAQDEPAVTAARAVGVEDEKPRRKSS